MLSQPHRRRRDLPRCFGASPATSRVLEYSRAHPLTLAHATPLLVVARICVTFACDMANDAHAPMSVPRLLALWLDISAKQESTSRRSARLLAHPVIREACLASPDLLPLACSASPPFSRAIWAHSYRSGAGCWDGAHRPPPHTSMP
ncbi:hypothetical protein PYCCODRAFT_1287165 [Trametes coccinea BRFM310]|uniref:Uncharacterized protein n=1 Tax=Trametes coccinea (strain BRFM310) TaxID=1353009 RepID=A0A1Y2IWX1_TRAC3|nr:hypothetical protein PYCCODRAFT_1287165 [Trametes coccinea BRFM310]